MIPKFMIAVLSLGLAGVGLAACAHQREVGTTTEMGTPGETVAQDTILPSWQALVTPTTAEGGVMGEVTIRATTGGDTYTAIEIEKATPGATHPWHVHSGDCGSGGGIVGAATAYAPITVDAGGEGEANATIAVELDPDGDYYVNVHQSPDDLATIVACGEVESQ